MWRDVPFAHQQRPEVGPQTAPPPPPQGGGCLGHWPAPNPPPPPQIRKVFLRQKNETYKRGRKFEADVRYTNLFFGLWPPSLSNSPISHRTDFFACGPHLASWFGHRPKASPAPRPLSKPGACGRAGNTSAPGLCAAVRLPALRDARRLRGPSLGSQTPHLLRHGAIVGKKKRKDEKGALGESGKSSFAPLLMNIPFQLFCSEIAEIQVPHRRAPFSSPPPRAQGAQTTHPNPLPEPFSGRPARTCRICHPRR